MTCVKRAALFYIRYDDVLVQPILNTQRHYIIANIVRHNRKKALLKMYQSYCRSVAAFIILPLFSCICCLLLIRRV
jgi:hypothetical protein